MCDLIESLFMNIKPEDIAITMDEKVFDYYDKDKDELLTIIGKLQAENHSLTQRLVGLDLWLKEVIGEYYNENCEKPEQEKLEKKDDVDELELNRTYG